MVVLMRICTGKGQSITVTNHMRAIIHKDWKSLRNVNFARPFLLNPSQ